MEKYAQNGDFPGALCMDVGGGRNSSMGVGEVCMCGGGVWGCLRVGGDSSNHL